MSPFCSIDPISFQARSFRHVSGPFEKFPDSLVSQNRPYNSIRNLRRFILFENKPETFAAYPLHARLL